jgi:methionine sulfoxide reductase catalytic subunit
VGLGWEELVHIRRRRGWEIPERLATPESVWLNRRQILAAGALALTGATPAHADIDPTASLYPAPRNSRYAVERAITPEAINTSYNNFFEFGLYKQVARAAEALPIRPWEISFAGLLDKEFVITFDDLIRKMQLEERIYRHRCVEGWSMTVPWTGFPLAALVALAKPSSNAKYLQFDSFHDPHIATAQNSFYPWPYLDGITLAEAMNELAFVVTGAYGRPVAKVMGAPLRVHLPWKYGFKSVKSIVKFTFTDERPIGFYQQIAPAAYGFWANVNPDTPHPRWSQATERDIGTGERIQTRLFNGYTEFVASLYAGQEGEALYL